eukprot:CAMPEP_0181191372 /NCGR_PEP_ID=MMETSP1096-20121128/12701_1 /TAXON_ID=156174 ORGANISM="Chrysochromulina ericina, Strain CCMP281" /NCGR_SAMPLE_ID=MMETSP1096 /ASSEMBLY_ACC=CAM_ASM_000453 /LENGTH=191 /DNA_ID=CAMNT_0023280669 /DNA_START=46 /DNA_END=621 /DNA_ORIENTATION=-
MTRNVTRVAERTFRSVKQSVAKYLMHDLVKESVAQALSHLRSRTAHYLHLVLFGATSRVPMASILHDQWVSIRNAKPNIRADRALWNSPIQRRRASKVNLLLGVGYTPRIVALAGLMLRGLHASTALPAVFDPPLGLGAGACLAARCTHREWLACIMLGWYGGGGYWHLLGVHPPPDFEGVPISVRKVRRG